MLGRAQCLESTFLCNCRVFYVQLQSLVHRIGKHLYAVGNLLRKYWLGICLGDS